MRFEKDTLASNIQLIVGLGNPGKPYSTTRHNAGAWFVDHLAKSYQATFKLERKFHGSLAQIHVDSLSCWLLTPTTFMNESGRAIRAFAQFHKLSANQILVAHDELDFPAGTVRLKYQGGHGGHNGLRDIISHLGTHDFYRLRLGIGHPRDRDRVHDYVLSQPSHSDKQQIEASIDEAASVIPLLLAGKIEQAMQRLHTTDIEE